MPALQKTRGIVFRFTRYGETSIIVTIFTEQFGLQSYIVNGVWGRSSRKQLALFQPLTLLDLVVYYRENAPILRIKEVKCIHAYQTLDRDIRKSAIAMFLTEIINRTVKDQSQAEELGCFLIDSLIALDESSKPENFHLIFLLKLSRYLGFGAQSNDEVLDGWPLDDGHTRSLQALLGADYSTVVPLSGTSRRILLDSILHFYAIHTDNFGEIKSVSVLKEMFN
ncbi:MAG TPA: DNA repair protein RecO [Cyclobacteriaceae bacterium]|nr:DNA repair protein RecO [Cyclobacteriaceae bacterium]